MTLLKSFEDLDYSEALESNKEAQDWLESNNRRFGQLINGKFVSVKNAKLIESLNPSTSELLAHIEIANSDQLESAVKSARKAQPSWEKIGGHGRAKALYALARLMQKHARIISVLETLDNGKTHSRKSRYRYSSCHSTFFITMLDGPSFKKKIFLVISRLELLHKSYPGIFHY